MISEIDSQNVLHGPDTINSSRDFWQTSWMLTSCMQEAAAIATENNFRLPKIAIYVSNNYIYVAELGEFDHDPLTGASRAKWNWHGVDRSDCSIDTFLSKLFDDQRLLEDQQWKPAVTIFVEKNAIPKRLNNELRMKLQDNKPILVDDLIIQPVAFVISSENR